MNVAAERKANIAPGAKTGKTILTFGDLSIKNGNDLKAMDFNTMDMAKKGADYAKFS